MLEHQGIGKHPRLAEVGGGHPKQVLPTSEPKQRELEWGRRSQDSSWGLRRRSQREGGKQREMASLAGLP